jgi:hypothetical protein
LVVAKPEHVANRVRHGIHFARPSNCSFIR